MGDTHGQPGDNLNLKISGSQLRLHDKMTWRAFRNLGAQATSLPK